MTDETSGTKEDQELAALQEQLQRLEVRCKGVGWKTQIDEVNYRRFVDPDRFEAARTYWLKVQVPAQQGSREVRWGGRQELGVVEATAFEHLRFLDGYEGVWSDEGWVECEVAGGGSVLTRSRLNQLFSLSKADDDVRTDADQPGQIVIDWQDEGVRIRLGDGSDAMRALCYVGLRTGSKLTLRIEKQGIRTGNQARALLEKIGNSVLFRLHLTLGVALHLSEDQEVPGSRLRDPMSTSIAAVGQPPTHEYDREPMELYWYATSADRMPLLQFLAFYQVLEFYFPMYWEREAQTLVRDRLKDPTFDPGNNFHVDRIIRAVRGTGRGGRAFGDERSQLQATINACLTSDEIREFLEEDPPRKEWLSTKKGDLVGVKTRLVINNPTADLRTDACQRIYEIRCRIVHTKAGSEDDVPLMLPFSREARNLRHDLELVRYVAREVLIDASRPIRLDPPIPVVVF